MAASSSSLPSVERWWMESPHHAASAGSGRPLQSLDEIAMVELDGEGYALQVLGGEFERGL